MEERALNLWGIEAVKGLQVGSHGLSVAASQAPDSVSPIMGDLSRSPSPAAAPAAVNTGTQRPSESATPWLSSKYRRRRDRAPTREETVMATLTKNDSVIAEAISNLANSIDKMAEAIKLNCVTVNELTKAFVECNNNHMTQIVMLLELIRSERN